MTTNVVFAAASVGFTPVFIALALGVLALALGGPLILGAVLIQERQVGIVVKRFSARSLPPGRLIALEIGRASCRERV